jgi:hypothetical protein
MSREVEATAKLAPCPQCGEVHGEDLLRCPATDTLLPLEGRRLDGKFRFLSSLGSGGMASVYLAVNERVDREVAIKFLRPEVGRDPESVARFRSEAKAAGRIGNEHICEILDLGDSPIGPYIVMERLRGIDLAALIRRQGRLAPGYAVRVVRHALEGLAAAHAAGIVHRDLKPGNIFLHRTDAGDTIVKLMDFGVSKFLDGTGEAQTASGILLGTPEYMAPEQLEGAHKIGPPADIWAMGAILYRAITGQQVFSGPNLAAVIKSMALDEVTPISRLVEGVPPELEAVIHRCLDRDIENRYPTAEELSEALAPFEELEVEVIPIAQPEPTRDLPISSLPIPAKGDAGGGDEVPRVTETQIFEAEDEAAKAAAPAATAKPAGSGGRTGMKIAVTVFVLAGLAFVLALALTQGWLGGQDRGEPTPAGAEAETGAEGAAAASETGALADLPAATETGAAEAGAAEADETETGAEADETETGAEADETGTGDGETDDGGDGSWVPSTDRPAPPGTFRSGAYISPLAPGSTTDLAGAKQHCANLASNKFAGQGGWNLANPAQLAKFIGNREIKRARYWTTALHKGRAWVYSMPSGKKSSEKASRKIARPLCVTKY